ncbi:hypothetical protein FRC09_001915 [Ceratobasidium sp. 395]|nr:hypothetical protein FRC09_001915 [Ceratobasidium sp. 395]
MAAASPPRWTLNRQSQDPNTFPWLQEFDTWASRRHVHVDWVIHKHPDPPHHGWGMKLRLNGHLLDPVGQGDTKANAKINLVRQLENAEPAVFVSSLQALLDA